LVRPVRCGAWPAWTCSFLFTRLFSEQLADASAAPGMVSLGYEQTLEGRRIVNAKNVVRTGALLLAAGLGIA